MYFFKSNEAAIVVHVLYYVRAYYMFSIEICAYQTILAFRSVFNF